MVVTWWIVAFLRCASECSVWRILKVNLVKNKAVIDIMILQNHQKSSNIYIGV